MQTALEGELGQFFRRLRATGARSFYIPRRGMARLLEGLLGNGETPEVSLNRPQAGGHGLVHRVLWNGMTFTSVSEWPIVVL